MRAICEYRPYRLGRAQSHRPAFGRPRRGRSSRGWSTANCKRKTNLAPAVAYSKSDQTHLVRLGGAGAVLPRLLVVRRICTLPFALQPVENVLSLDVVEPVSVQKQTQIVTFRRQSPDG